ncbi:GIY-YIG catalytic domain-containing endonuclease [Paramecium bursaria Chlorella virus NE-JV-1]|nr:GIY-YIG catalytic domain-containing endonuclease [Paramecium bursaria Chlorella virus NE-JV-1]
MGFIYMLTSSSGKSYIGQTIRPIHERLAEHQYESSGCRAISAAIQKYGWENFEKEWYEVPDEDLNKHEELMVEVLGTLAPGGYNLKEGGGAHGRPSEESKKK